MMREMARHEQKSRGCVYFNFGAAYALQLLVSIHSLREHYSGPITVFFVPDKYSDALKKDIGALGAEVRMLENLSRSFDRHRVFHESPYETTLLFDSDIIFQGPIDALWEPLEEEGVLATRFFAPPFGVDGTAKLHRDPSRVQLLENVKELVEPSLFEHALRRMVDDRIDINVGVFGISRPRGDAFLADWARHMERGRNRSIPILDEMLVVALIDGYPHYLADEIWNCPADEHFRCTNLADAVIIHYFADGHRLFHEHRMGRNSATWAGRKWYKAYFDAASALDLSRWRVLDRKFDRWVEPPFAHGAIFTFRNWLKDAERGVRSVRGLILGRSSWHRFH